MIAAGFEQNFSNGERPFVVVNAKDGALGFHKPRWAFWGLPARSCSSKPVSRREAIMKWLLIFLRQSS